MKTPTNVYLFLQQIVEDHLQNKKNTYKKTKTSKPKEEFLNAFLKDLDYFQSDTFFTPQYINKVREILGDPSDLSNLSAYKNKQAQVELDKLTKDEFE
jgi:hypothetical protein